MVYQGSPDTQLSDYALQQGNPKSSVFHKQRLLKTAIQLLKRQKKKSQGLTPESPFRKMPSSLPNHCSPVSLNASAWHEMNQLRKCQELLCPQPQRQGQTLLQTEEKHWIMGHGAVTGHEVEEK